MISSRKISFQIVNRYCKLNSGIFATNSLANFRLFLFESSFRAIINGRASKGQLDDQKRVELWFSRSVPIIRARPYGLKFQSAPATSEDANLFRARARRARAGTCCRDRQDSYADRSVAARAPVFAFAFTLQVAAFRSDYYPQPRARAPSAITSKPRNVFALKQHCCQRCLPRSFFALESK